MNAAVSGNKPPFGKRTTFRFFKHYIKLAMGASYELVEREADIAQHNRHSPVWFDLGVYYQKKFGIGKAGIFVSRWVPTEEVTPGDIQQFTELVLTRAKAVTAQIGWRDAFDPQLFGQLWGSLNGSQQRLF